MPISNKYITDTELMQMLDPLAKKVVGRYVANKAIPRREAEDVEMGILEKFMMRKDHILTSFEGKAKLTTYCIAVLNRMCCEQIRKDSKHWHMVQDEEKELLRENHGPAYESESATLIKLEVKRLETAMLFFNGNRAKVRLFLKYLNDLPLKDTDFEDYNINNKEELKKLLRREERTKKGDLYQQMAEAVRIAEQKNVQGDALRMWLNKQSETLINRLNAAGGSKHTQESLAILLEVSEMNSS